MSNHEFEVGDEIIWTHLGAEYLGRILGIHKDFSDIFYVKDYATGFNVTLQLSITTARVVPKNPPKLDTSTPYVEMDQLKLLGTYVDRAAEEVDRVLIEALDEVDRALYRTRQVSAEDMAAQYPEPVCDCGAVKAQTSHAGWCSTVKEGEK